jgi:hypothetical protein
MLVATQEDYEEYQQLIDEECARHMYDDGDLEDEDSVADCGEVNTKTVELPDVLFASEAEAGTPKRRPAILPTTRDAPPASPSAARAPSHCSEMILEIGEQHRKFKDYRATLKLQHEHAESENICQQTKDEIVKEQQQLEEKILRAMRKLTGSLRETNEASLAILEVARDVENAVGLGDDLGVVKGEVEKAVEALNTIF